MSHVSLAARWVEARAVFGAIRKPQEYYRLSRRGKQRVERAGGPARRHRPNPVSPQRAAAKAAVGELLIAGNGTRLDIPNRYPTAVSDGD